MKRKPALFRKLEGKYHGRYHEVIGLIGTHHGVGVTHTGLMLAFYMGEELGKKTAFLECNQHHDMALLQSSYEWSREEADTFSFRRITCYKEVTAKRLLEVFRKDYECIILDFGVDYLSGRDEFLRCTTKIIIGGRSEWDIQKLLRFTRSSVQACEDEAWLYFIPQAKDKVIKRISNETGRKVLSVPRHEEPTLPSRDTSRFFEDIFRVK